MTVQPHKAKPVSRVFLRKFAKKSLLSRPHPFRGRGSICREARLPWQPSYPTRAHHSSVQIFLWVPMGAIFDYFCDQDSLEMIALKMKQIHPKTKKL